MTVGQFRILLLIGLFGWLAHCPSLSAQFNVEAGYSYSFFKSAALEGQLAEYQLERQGRRGDLSKVFGLNGIELAGIYHLDRWSTSIFWTYKRDRNKSTYLAMDGLTELEEIVSLTSNTLGLSVQANLERFSVGNRTGYEFFKLKFTGNLEHPDQKIKMGNGIVTQFFAAYEFPGNDAMRVMIRPFYQINLFEWDLAPVAAALDVTHVPGKKAGYFGIGLIFTNGLPRY